MLAKTFRPRNLVISERRLSKGLIAFFLIVGVSIRIFWAVVRPSSGASGEAANVAVAIANGRGFADAYAVGQGPTVHLLPISPSIAGGVYSLLGVRSLPAEFILTSWSLLLVFGAFLLLFRAFSALGTPVWGRVGALGLLCIAPTYVVQESVDFRIWEGALASFLTALFIERLTDAEQSRNVSLSRLTLIGAIAALLFFVNPPFGLGAVLAGAIFSLRRLTQRKAFFLGLASACFLLAMLGPWVLRNASAMGEPVLLRGNAGMELAIANHPGAVNPADPKSVFLNRLQTVHPAQSREAYDRMQQAGGELAYSRQLGDEAYGWIVANKGQALGLSLRHVRQVFLPEPWQFASSGSGMAATPRALTACLVSLFGLLGLGAALAAHRWQWLYPVTIIAVPALALALFQPVPRYTYLFYPILAFAAADVVSRIATRCRRSAPGN